MNLEELTELATLYYVNGQNQEQLATQFNISRATVGRMLKRAEQEGIVEIRVRHHPKYTNNLENELKDRFNIHRALISIDHPDAETQRKLLASVVSSYLDNALSEHKILAVGMGRNVSAVSKHDIQVKPRTCLIVSGTGGAYRGGEDMNSDHISRRFANHFGGESETLYAPALVEDTVVRQAILSNETVKQTLDKAKRADMALVGIGEASVDSHTVRMGWFSAQEITTAKANGAVGDLLGYDFFDIHGQPCAENLRGHVVGLSLADLYRIPDVIAIASEAVKATAILGALRTGAINTLATTSYIANMVISLDDITRKAS